MIRPANPGEVANPDDAYFGGCHTPPYPPPHQVSPLNDAGGSMDDFAADLRSDYERRCVFWELVIQT
jgi:hypothetical protein